MKGFKSSPPSPSHLVDLRSVLEARPAHHFDYPGLHLAVSTRLVFAPTRSRRRSFPVAQTRGAKSLAAIG